MASISRDSLQWQSAVNTFTSILISGLATILVSGYVTYTQSNDIQLSQLDLFIYMGIAIGILLISAALFATRSYLELSRPLDHLEQITHTLPLLS